MWCLLGFSVKPRKKCQLQTKHAPKSAYVPNKGDPSEGLGVETGEKRTSQTATRPRTSEAPARPSSAAKAGLLRRSGTSRGSAVGAPQPPTEHGRPEKKEKESQGNQTNVLRLRRLPSVQAWQLSTNLKTCPQLSQCLRMLKNINCRASKSGVSLDWVMSEGKGRKCVPSLHTTHFTSIPLPQCVSVCVCVTEMGGMPR